MFRNIHSKEKSTTVLKEIQKEFAPHLKVADAKTKDLMNRHAKGIFVAMILLIVSSFILSFFVLKPKEVGKSELFRKELQGVSNGIYKEYSALKDLSKRTEKIAFLKSEIERILAKESISAQDSSYLEKAIEELQYFNIQSDKK